MADLPDTAIITANGTYEFPASTAKGGLLPNVEYLLAFKPIGAASIVVNFNTGPSGAFVAADNGTFDTAKSEDRFVAGATRIQMVVTGYSAPIKVTIQEFAR